MECEGVKGKWEKGRGGEGWKWKRTFLVTRARIHSRDAAFGVAAISEGGEAEVFEVVFEVVELLLWSD